MTDFNREELVADTAALDEFNRNVVVEFRANGGKVEPPFEGAPLLLLQTTGAKSGTKRLSPLAYQIVDGKMLIIGAYAGAPKHPAWVHNLRADPRAHIETGTEEFDVSVRELTADERETTYATLVKMAPMLAEYQTKTDRVIPLFELTRV